MTDSKITFYTNPMSRGQIARWALHEAGADYDQVLLDYDTSMKGEDYLKVNPMGKVPAIVHDGNVITECAAICAYLAHSYPDAGLAPADGEHADYYRWLFFTAGPVEQAVTDRHLGLNVSADQERMAGYGNYDRVMDVLDKKFQADDYVCGGRFTMADVYVGSQVDWGLQFQSFPERDSFKAYAERFRERDAYKAAKAVDMALMPENPRFAIKIDPHCNFIHPLCEPFYETGERTFAASRKGQRHEKSYRHHCRIFSSGLVACSGG